MTADELAAIKARCDAATPGPWEPGRQSPYTLRSPIHQSSEARKVNPLVWQRACICRETRDQDAEFIAHARTDIPALLDEVVRMRLALERVSKIYPTPYVKNICDVALEEAA